MAIEVTCQNCGAVLPAPDDLAGQQIRCAVCETIVEVPAAAAEQPKQMWDDDPPAAPRTNVLTGTAVGWLLLLGLLACAGLVLLGLAVIPA